MKRAFAVIAFFIVSVAGASAQSSFPKVSPEKFRLCANGWCMTVVKSLWNHAYSGTEDGTGKEWELHLGVWDQKQVAFTGVYDSKDNDGNHKLGIFVGKPDDEPQERVSMHGLIYDGYERDEEEVMLTWDRADAERQVSRVYW